MIRVEIPFHLRTLAKVNGEVQVEASAPVTPSTIIDALEQKFPALRGTIREHGSNQRRALLRFFACGEDISHQSLDIVLPEAIINGSEPFMIVGAIAGG